jgi:hypothetical protein
VNDNRCCLQTLLDVLYRQRGLSGSDSEADIKAMEVAQYIACFDLGSTAATPRTTGRSTTLVHGFSMVRRSARVAKMQRALFGLKLEPFLEPRALGSWNRWRFLRKTLIKSMVWVTGFEPATPTSRTHHRGPERRYGTGLTRKALDRKSTKCY